MEDKISLHNTLTISSAQVMRIKKISFGGLLVEHVRIVWQTVERNTDEIVGAKELTT